ncbi:TonB-dependent receptor [Altererythrobacter indicus]|uniref:TonB-dependent receptor n=1 Tax=Altericroceibacterium indicum TaxID=374177 RepID=A0A845A8L5_9SPHN|nr:TonB-dependent receptor [Altericroceibacterium indicum]MXP26712.1 TonB-dependent receptor [Altericroceibacterium indicum]
MRKALLLCACATAPVTATGLAPTAFAQTSEATASDITEIVVTAQRRDENLQDVPIAITALNGDNLDAKAVERISDLQFAAPSLSITDQGLTQSVNIRGIGISSGSPAVANGVATYIDGVFQPPIMTSSSFYDIASIEVLRGPQGTLVGSNSTGGAIFINTKDPSLGAVEGYAEASYGNYDAFSAEGAINLPISSTLAIRAAGTSRTRDSYYTDLGPFKNHAGKLDEQAGRLGILFEPGSFKAIGKIEWVDKNTGGYAYRPILGTAFDNNRTDNIRELTYNAPTLNHERGFLSSLRLSYTLDNGIELRSVSGYTNKRINNLYDSDGAILPGKAGQSPNQTQDQFVRERQWSQEFNIISPTDGVFNWILGGYYQKNKVDVDIQTASDVPTDPTDIVQGQNKTTWGVFAQTGYHLTDALELQVGARYSHFKAKGAGSVTIGAGGPIFGPNGLQVADLAGSHQDGRMTGKVTLNYKADNNNVFYVFAARGYKPGGANSAVSEFGPETVWDYEAGWKATLLDGHLQSQLGGFYMDYSNFQFDARDTGTGQTGVFNVANATIKGIEWQGQASFGGFNMDGGIAYVDSHLDAVTLVNQRALPALSQYGPQCADGVESNPPVCFNYKPYIVTAGDGPNLFSPKWSYNIGAQYEFDFGRATLTPRVNYAYVGSRWTNLVYNPELDYLKGRGLLSAQVTLKMDDWTLVAYGTNLADKKYVSGQSGNNEFYGAPREYGVRASVRF